MTLLILGVALWWGAHLFKRIAPRARAGMGTGGKGAVTAALVIAILLMVIGYRGAEATIWWAATPMLKGVNNLLVLVAFYLFAAAGSKSRLGVRLRHPQLIGFAIWAGAHLMVNGDAPSVVLFGGLLAWALVEIAVINRAQPGWTAPAHPVPVRKEFTTVLATLAVYVVVGLIHGWIGPTPWGA